MELATDLATLALYDIVIFAGALCQRATSIPMLAWPLMLRRCQPLAAVRTVLDGLPRQTRMRRAARLQTPHPARLCYWPVRVANFTPCDRFPAASLGLQK